MTATLSVVTNTDKRPEVKISLDLAAVADQGVRALAGDGSVFQRGGVLVHVVTTLQGSPLVRELPAAVLRTRLSTSARWLRHTGGAKGTWKAVNVPDAIVHAIHTRGEWGGVRPLQGVVTCPTLRPDGSVLQDAGYDPPTSLLHWPAVPFVGVNERPTREEARCAAEAILDLTCDFPFATPADRTGWLAGVLTLMGRHAIDGAVPFFLVQATTRSSGKSKLVDVASIIATGAPAPRTPMPTNDDEFRKQVLSLLLAGDQLILLDNIANGRKFGGATFDAVLTATRTWKDRVLGRTGVMEVPARAVWWGTGNNPRLGGDLPRRTMSIQLASDLEDPENRTGFRYPDLLGHTLARRHVLVAQALTILRGYCAAGRPFTGGEWGSCEAWSQLVLGAIRWCGLPDPLPARATRDDTADLDKAHAGAVLSALLALRQTGLEWITTKDLIHELYPQGEQLRVPSSDAYAAAREAFEANTAAGRGIPSTVDVGKFLARVRGRVVDRHRIVSKVDPHTKIQRWTAEEVRP